MAHYEYNNEKLKELEENGIIKKGVIRKKFNYSNTRTIDRWLSGADIYVSRLVEICNLHELSPIEFFIKDKTPLIETIALSTPYSSGENLSKAIIEKERSISEAKLESQKQISQIQIEALKTTEKAQKEALESISHEKLLFEKERNSIHEELHKMKEQHAIELAELKVELMEKHILKQEEVRQQCWKELRMEMKEKEEEILNLKHKIIMLEYELREYKDLYPGSPQRNSSHVVNEPISKYKKTR